MCADLARLPSLLYLLFKLKGLIGEHSCPQMTQMNADKSATGSNGISRDLVQAPSSCATHEVSLCQSLHLRHLGTISSFPPSLGPITKREPVSIVWREPPLASHFLSSSLRIAQNLSRSSSCSFERPARAGRMWPGDCRLDPRREWCGVLALAVAFPPRRA